MSKKKQNPVIEASDNGNDICEAEIATNNVGSKNRLKLSFYLLIAVILVFSVVCFVIPAFSWFSPGEEADLSVAASAFSTETLYSVSGSDYSTLNDNVNIDISNLNSLRLQVSYSGYSSAYVRVKLFSSFMDADGKLLSASDLSYTLSEDWVEKDGYFYYKNIVSQTQTSSSPKKFNLSTRATLPEGVTYPSGAYINLVSVVETVQPDRFDEFFGISYEDVFGTENN